MGPMRDVLVLTALPASGKSEIRRYLDHLDGGGHRDLGIGRPVHLDDYPYVHLMRRISEETGDGVFFASPNLPFRDGRDWSTLTALLDEDAAWVLRGSPPPCGEPGALLDRLDRVRARFGIDAAFAAMDPPQRAALEEALADEAAGPAADVAAAAEAWRPGDCTLVVEFARGGPEAAPMPLDPPLGYRHALGLLAPPLLARATVLYVWVTPAESRRRNLERAVPGLEGDASILHHGVPETVMRSDYGCDDMAWLLETAQRPGTIDVPAAGGIVTIPAARLDNRDDLTSHLRGDPADWDRDVTAELHRRLAAALTGGVPR